VSAALCAATSHRDAAPTPLGVRDRVPPEATPAVAAHHPSRDPFLGCHAPRDARSPRRATRRHVIRAVLAGRAPLSPAVRPRPSPLVRRTTAGAVTPSSPPVGPPLFKVPAFLLALAPSFHHAAMAAT
jgi:hypothetical protein